MASKISGDALWMIAVAVNSVAEGLKVQDHVK